MATKTLIAKLAEIMAEIDHVEKRGRNQFHNYNYVKAADLANAVRQKLAVRQVVMMSDVVNVRNYETKDRKDQIMYGVDLTVKYTFYDGESEQTVAFHGYGSGLDAGDKASYKAQTGALKYALRNAFLVPDESDPEADSKTDEKMEGKAAKKKAEAVQPTMVRGKVEKFATKEDEDGETVVYALIGETQVFSSTDPNRTRLIDLNESGLAAEFVIMQTERRANGKPLFSVHTISPIPTQVPDEKLGAALKQSVDHLASQKSLEQAEKASNSFLDESVDPHRASGLVKAVRGPVGKGAMFVEIVSSNGTVASLSTFSKTLQKRLEESVNNAVVLRYKLSDDGKYKNLTDVERVGQTDFTEGN